MKVALVSQYFWPESFSINALTRALHARGIEVTVLTGQPNYPEGKVFAGYAAWRMRREEFEGIEVMRLPLYPRGQGSALRLALNYLSFVVAGLTYGPWLLRGRRFDVVFVYAPSPLLQALPAIWLAWWKRAPMVLWVQDLWPESLTATGFVQNRIVLRFIASVVRFIYRHADRILIPSEAFRQPIMRLLKHPERIHYYPNAYVEDPEPFSGIAQDPRASPAFGALVDDIANGFSIVFAGNLGSAQSLETIINAAEILQNRVSPIRFFLIGSGSQSDWMKEEIQRRALHNVLLPGRFPPRDMGAIYAAASALLVSLRDEPIFALTIPSKLQGYLASGKPVIASLNGEGARVVAKAGAGVVCRAADPNALANAALNLYHIGADARRQMGENGRRYAIDHFALGLLTEDLTSQLESLVANHREKRT